MLLGGGVSINCDRPALVTSPNLCSQIWENWCLLYGFYDIGAGILYRKFVKKEISFSFQLLANSFADFFR